MNKVATAGLASLYVVLSGIAAVGADTPTDLDVYFLPSAAIALAGQPWSVYTVRSITSVATYANANGPLSLIPLIPVAAIAGRLGLFRQARWLHMLVAAVFSVFLLWLGREALRAIDRCCAVRPGGIWRFLVLAMVIASPVIWLSEIGYGHVEQPIALALTLLAVQALADDRPVLAGLALGLTGLARTLTLVFAIPLTVLLWRRRGPATTLRMGSTALATMGIGLLPFLLSDPKDVLFSMVTQHANLPVGIGSIWYPGAGTPIAALGEHIDTLCITIAVVLTTLAVLRIRPDLGFGSADLYGLLAIAGIWVVVLIKIVWPYYLMEPFVLATIWWVARIQQPSTRRALVPAYLTVATLVAEFATRREHTIAGGLATFALVALLGVFIVCVFRALGRRTEPALTTDRLESDLSEALAL